MDSSCLHGWYYVQPVSWVSQNPSSHISWTSEAFHCLHISRYTFMTRKLTKDHKRNTTKLDCPYGAEIKWWRACFNMRLGTSVCTMLMPRQSMAHSLHAQNRSGKWQYEHDMPTKRDTPAFDKVEESHRCPLWITRTPVDVCTIQRWRIHSKAESKQNVA